jgi:hypothetical protein
MHCVMHTATLAAFLLALMGHKGMAPLR